MERVGETPRARAARPPPGWPPRTARRAQPPRRAPALRARARTRARARRPARTPGARSTRRRRPPRRTSPRPSARRAVRAQRETLEQRDGGEHREHRHQPQPQQRGERGKQQAVAGQIVAGVPVLVPHREAEMFEQADPVDLSRQIGGARIDDQPQRQKHRGHAAARGAVRRARVRCEDPRRRAGPSPAGPRDIGHAVGRSGAAAKRRSRAGVALALMRTPG